MRIGFTGAQGTGKTMVSQALKKRPEFQAYYFPPSSARLLVTAGINKDASPLSQFLITVDRVMTIAAYPDVVTDRTAIDSWAYTEYQLMHSWTPDEVPTGYAAITNQYVDLAMLQIDHLFYFPPYWPPVGDGYRSAERRYQLDIDDLIRHGIRKFYPGQRECITMPEATVADRVEMVLDSIGA